MELSVIASFTAAVISLMTLVLTTYFAGRRERVKWAREALAEAFYDFVDASYSASNAVHQHQKHLWQGSDEDSILRTANDMQAQVLALRHAQTKIRLLAPGKTVNLANEVRFRVKEVVLAVSPAITAEQHERNRVIIAEARSKLIDSAKKYRRYRGSGPMIFPSLLRMEATLASLLPV
jgi:hypothetical protein